MTVLVGIDWGDADPRRLYRADGTLVPIVELDEDAAGMIAAIEVEARRTTRVRMWDKNQALEKAHKRLGLYERKNTQRSDVSAGVAGGGADERARVTGAGADNIDAGVVFLPVESF